MAIDLKLIYFDTKQLFLSKLENKPLDTATGLVGQIPYRSIVFIKDTAEVWTHGLFIGGIVCDNYNNHAINLKNIVTTNTNLEITGQKTFVTFDPEFIINGLVFTKFSDFWKYLQNSGIPYFNTYVNYSLLKSFECNYDITDPVIIGQQMDDPSWYSLQVSGNAVIYGTPYLTETSSSGNAVNKGSKIEVCNLGINMYAREARFAGNRYTLNGESIVTTPQITKLEYTLNKKNLKLIVHRGLPKLARAGQVFYFSDGPKPKGHTRGNQLKILRDPETEEVCKPGAYEVIIGNEYLYTKRGDNYYINKDALQRIDVYNAECVDPNFKLVEGTLLCVADFNLLRNINEYQDAEDCFVDNNNILSDNKPLSVFEVRSIKTSNSSSRNLRYLRARWQRVYDLAHFIGIVRCRYKYKGKFYSCKLKYYKIFREEKIYRLI